MFVLIVELSKEVKDLNFGKCVAASLSYNKQFLEGKFEIHRYSYRSILCVIRT